MDTPFPHEWNGMQAACFFRSANQTEPLVTVKVASVTHESPLARSREGSGGEMGNSRSHAPCPTNDSGVQAGMRPAREETVMAFIIRGV